MKRDLKFETPQGQRLYASLLEHQAQMERSGEAERWREKDRQFFWRFIFPYIVLPLNLLGALLVWVLVDVGADPERIVVTVGVDMFITMVFLIGFYPPKKKR